MAGPRKHNIWSLKNFNDGYARHNRKTGEHRFFVYLPNHHRANSCGYVLRSIVAYEAYHPGEIVTKDFVVHHKDRNTLNDLDTNLDKITHDLHMKHHFKKPEIRMMCENCKLYFNFKVAKYSKETRNLRRFCSQKCYHESSTGRRTPRATILRMRVAQKKRWEERRKRCVY